MVNSEELTGATEYDATDMVSLTNVTENTVFV